MTEDAGGHSDNDSEEAAPGAGSGLPAQRGPAKNCQYDYKESACNAGDLSSILGLGRSPGEGNGNHSNILAWNLMDRGVW